MVDKDGSELRESVESEDAAESVEAGMTQAEKDEEDAKKRKDARFMLVFCAILILVAAAIGVGLYFLTGGASSGCNCGKCMVSPVRN